MVSETDRARLQERGRKALEAGLKGNPPALFVIIGAGVSIATTRHTQSEERRAVGWIDLLKKCCAFAQRTALDVHQLELKDIKTQLDNPRISVAQYIRSTGELERILVKNNVFGDFFREQFGLAQQALRSDSSFERHALYRQLKHLQKAGARLITLNYDTLLELAIRLRPIDWTSNNSDVTTFFTSSNPSFDDLVMHLHGRWNDVNSVIFGQESYDRILGNRPAHPAVHPDSVKTIRDRLTIAFADQHVLFVGCGNTTSDPHFAQIFEDNKKLRNQQDCRHVFLCSDADYDTLDAPGNILKVPYGNHDQLVDAFSELFPGICTATTAPASSAPHREPGIATAGLSAQPNATAGPST